MPKGFETKIPPPMLAVLFISFMWLADQYSPGSVIDETFRISVAIGLSLFGALSVVLGIVSFVRAKTTLNPLQPEKAGTLVTTGIYKYTRNPMYLGMLCVLLAWGLFLANGFSLVLAILFIPVMNFLQILPEERAMELNFREHYIAYKGKVRRWL
jgi:protein-S-isoprenylcysteine O-methyltransferase Ste14